MTLEERVRRIEDLEEIRRLRNMYHYFVNERLPERFPRDLHRRCRDGIR